MRSASVLVILVALLGLSACNTMKGMGADVQVGGKAISNLAQKTQKAM